MQPTLTRRPPKMSFNITFEDFYEWDRVKTVSVTLQMLVIAIGPFLLGSIVWYEKHGGHSTQRTIVNRLVTVICTCHILIYLPTNFAYILGNNI
jgi:hypothetical protein